MKFRSVEAEVSHADGRTQTKLVFRNFVNVPRNKSERCVVV